MPRSAPLTGAAIDSEATALSWPIVAAAVGVIMAVSLFTHSPYHNTDVSWLITVSEKVLAGKILYKDVLETNPPGAVLLYLPATFLGNSAGLRPEDLVSLQTYLAGLLSLGLSYRILPNQIGGLSNFHRPFLLLGAFNLFVLPMDAFAQREHFATMMALPMVSAFVRFAETGTWPGFWLRSASVLLAAMMLTLKPYFALPGLFVVLHAMARARSWRPLWDSGMLAAGLLGAVLTVISLWAFPHYVSDMLPILRDVYVPTRSDLMALLLGEYVLMATILTLAICFLLVAAKHPPPGVAVILLVSASFLLGYFIQGKGFPYHAYPALVYAFMIYGLLIWRRLIDAVADAGQLSIIGGATYPATSLVIVGLAVYGMTPNRPPMVDISWAKELKSPSVMMLSKEPQVSFPLVRMIRANWVDSANGQWMAYYTKFMMMRAVVGQETYRTLTSFHQRDIKAAIATMQREKPEIVLVDTSPYLDWLRWELFAACPGLLNGYMPIASEKNVLVMRRTRTAAYGCGL